MDMEGLEAEWFLDQPRDVRACFGGGSIEQ